MCWSDDALTLGSFVCLRSCRLLISLRCLLGSAGTVWVLLGGTQRLRSINNAECFRGNCLATTYAALASCVWEIEWEWVEEKSDEWQRTGRGENGKWARRMRRRWKRWKKRTDEQMKSRESREEAALTAVLLSYDRECGFPVLCQYRQTRIRRFSFQPVKSWESFPSESDELSMITVISHTWRLTGAWERTEKATFHQVICLCAGRDASEKVHVNKSGSTVSWHHSDSI